MAKTSSFFTEPSFVAPRPEDARPWTTPMKLPQPEPSSKTRVKCAETLALADNPIVHEMAIATKLTGRPRLSVVVGANQPGQLGDIVARVRCVALVDEIHLA